MPPILQTASSWKGKNLAISGVFQTLESRRKIRDRLNAHFLAVSSLFYKKRMPVCSQVIVRSQSKFSAFVNVDFIDPTE